MSSPALNLFIIDDNPLMVTGLTAFLDNKFGDTLNITSFSSGEAALEKIDRSTNIIVLDYFLDTLKKDAANGMENIANHQEALPCCAYHYVVESGALWCCHANHSKGS
jgi:DNA-binding NarL/FixJ family response regulator